MKKFVPLLLALALLCGCSEGGQNDDKAFASLFAMDTYMELTAYGDGAESALDSAAALITELDGKFSLTADDSAVSLINSSDGQSVPVDGDTAALLAAALEISSLTGGAFDATIAPLTEAWGFTGAQRVPSETEIASLLPLVDYRRLQCDDGSATLGAGMKIDLGGVAKGFASQRAAELLRSCGVVSASLSLGGNVQVVGTKPDGSLWRVGIQDPAEPDLDEYIGILSVADCAVVTSGPYRRFFQQDGVVYHHILDPRTGYPAESGLTSVTVVCADGAAADALSTALFVMGKDKALELWKAHGGFEAALAAENGVLYVTGGLRESFAPVQGSGYEVCFID